MLRELYSISSDVWYNFQNVLLTHVDRADADKHKE